MTNSFARKAYRVARRAVFSVREARARQLAWRAFMDEFQLFAAEASRRGIGVPSKSDLYPCLSDRTAETEFEPHYTYHTAWACRELQRLQPSKHVDIGSYLRFCAMASAWVPMVHIDFRRPNLHLEGLETRSGDILALPFADGGVESLSCLHVLEHIGLGRYGDPLDPAGDLKGARELARILAVGGALLFVVPVGRSRTNFNAHRVYAFEQVTAMFPGLRLVRWSLVPDDYSKGMIENAAPALINAQEWGCGCFVFTKDSM